MLVKMCKALILTLAVISSIANAKESRIGPRLQPGVPRIIDGVAVTGQWDGRWACSMQDKWYGDYHMCGCNIIDNRTVLTAGHCAPQGWPEDIELYCGEKILSEATLTSKVTNIIRHKEYSSETLNNDVALLKLQTALKFDENTNMKPVVLPENPDVCGDGELCYVYGWGVTSEGGFSAAPNLMKTDVKIVSDSECQASYAAAGITVNPECMICAANPGKDSCQGDSGGPLICRTNVLCGTVSWGIGCARPEYPGVYAEVANFLDWIKICDGDKCMVPTGCETCC